MKIQLTRTTDKLTDGRTDARHENIIAPAVPIRWRADAWRLNFDAAFSASFFAIRTKSQNPEAALNPPAIRALTVSARGHLQRVSTQRLIGRNLAASGASKSEEWRRSMRRLSTPPECGATAAAAAAADDDDEAFLVRSLSAHLLHYLSKTLAYWSKDNNEHLYSSWMAEKQKKWETSSKGMKKCYQIVDTSINCKWIITWTFTITVQGHISVCTHRLS